MRCSFSLTFLASVAATAKAQWQGQVENQVFKGSYLIGNDNVDPSLGHEFLSSDQPNPKAAGLAYQDAGTGRQRWKLIYGGAIGTDWYSIVSAYGTAGSYDYLGTTDPSQAMVSVSMYPSDDGSGLQRWQLVKAPFTTNGTYYLRPYLAALTNQTLWLTQTYDISGARGVTMARLNASATNQAQWQLLQFTGEYNLISQNSFLSASTQNNGRGLATAPNDNGNGQQRVQFLQRTDGLYYLLVEGTGSPYKYVSILPGSQAQAYLDVRQTSNSAAWVLASSVANTFTLQDSRYGFYLTIPTASAPGQFLATGYVQGTGQNWVMQPTQGLPAGSCIQNVGNGQYLQGPLGSNWALIRGPASTWYQVKSASSSSTFSYLSLGAFGFGAPFLVSQDDGSGAQRWEISAAPTGFYIQPWATTNISGRYLAAQNGPPPLAMASQPDGTNLQAFYINQCPAAPSSYNNAGAVAAACVFGILGGLLLLGGLYYLYTRHYGLDLWLQKKPEEGVEGEVDLSQAEKGDGASPDTFGNAFMDVDDIKLDMQEPAKIPVRPRSRCLFFERCMPGRGVTIVAA